MDVMNGFLNRLKSQKEERKNPKETFFKFLHLSNERFLRLSFFLLSDNSKKNFPLSTIPLRPAWASPERATFPLLNFQPMRRSRSAREGVLSPLELNGTIGNSRKRALVAGHRAFRKPNLVARNFADETGPNAMQKIRRRLGRRRKRVSVSSEVETQKSRRILYASLGALRKPNQVRMFVN